MTSLSNDNENIACESCGKVIMREMSFCSVMTPLNNLSNKIEILYDDQNQPWFKRAHLGKHLNMKGIPMSIPQHVELRTREQLSTCNISGWKGDSNSKSKTDIFLSVNGVRTILLNSRKPKAIELAKELGITVHDHKYLKKETETMSYILKAFKGEDMRDQHGVDGYRVDLYFPSHKLAIECDEFGHKDRDIGYEVTRQKHIESKLGCTFIRYNPDDKDFDIFSVINSIMKYIYKQ